MTAVSAISLLAVMLLLAAIPSASVALVVTRSATLGLANGIATICGIVLGDLVFVALAIFGLSFLAETMGSFFAIIKYAGGGYLLWLGFDLLRSKNQTSFAATTTPRFSLLTSFTSGFVLTLGDVKAILFYVSLFPAFVDVPNLSASDVAAIMLVTILAVGGIKFLYAFAAQGIVRRLKNRNAQRITRSAAGCCMLVTGTYIIAKS